MARRREDGLHIAALDHASLLHHADRVGEASHQIEVVRDEQDRHAIGLLEPLQQRDDLRLYGDVERGRRLVRDEEVGLVGERHGDHDALALPAGKLMRIGAEPRLGVWNADLGEEFDHALARRVLPAHAMKFEDFRDLLRDRVQRIERGHGLLKDHGDACAANGAQLALADVEHVLPGEKRLAGGERARRQQPHDRERADRLAGAGFADERQRLAALDREGDAVDGERLAPALQEGDGEIADVEEGGGGHERARMLETVEALRVSPIRSCGKSILPSCETKAAQCLRRAVER